MMTAKMSDKDTREDIQKVFNLFDDDQTGHISLRNLKRVAKELGETMSGELELDRGVGMGYESYEVEAWVGLGPVNVVSWASGRGTSRVCLGGRVGLPFLEPGTCESPV